MDKRLLIAAIAAAPLAAWQPAAAAQSAPDARGDPNITVEGSRIVCRREVRTATRMRSGRVCRTQAEWRTTHNPNARNDIDDAANALDALGADDISTNDQRDPMDRTPDTPLGPR